LGLFADTGESITSIEIYGSDTFSREGIQGAGFIYGVIPEPTSLICWSLLGFLGVGYRRRKSAA
jgi:hypothetical protein